MNTAGLSTASILGARIRSTIQRAGRLGHRDDDGSYSLRWWAVAALGLIEIMSSIDTTVMNLAVPALSEDLNPTSDELLWIVDVYGFAIGALLIICGSTVDRLGARRIALIGAAGFAAGALLAGLATSPLMLILARALQGVAGGTMGPVALSLLRGMFARTAERAKAVAIWVSLYSVGGAFGPPIAAILIENVSWGSAFWVACPLAAVAMAMGYFLYPKDLPRYGKPLDRRGAVLVAGTLFGFVYLINEVPSEGLDATAIGCLAATLIGGTLLWRHLRHETDPLIDLDLLRNRMFRAIILINGVSMFLFVGIMLAVSQYFQVVADIPPTVTSLVMMPGMVLSVVATLVTGALLGLFAARTLLIVALGLSASGCAMIGLAVTILAGGLGGPIWWMGIGYVLLGIGTGMIDPVGNTVVVSVAPADRAGAAASLSETCYEIGSAMGLGILGAILGAAFRMGFAHDADGAAVGGELSESIVTAHEQFADNPAMLELADHAFSHGVVLVGAVATGVCVVAATVAWWGVGTLSAHHAAQASAAKEPARS